MMLLQENGAAIKVQKGRFFTCPMTFFTGTGIDFSLNDHKKQKGDDKEKDQEEEEEKKDED